MAANTEDGRPWQSLTEAELAALHEAEVGIEWLRRAHGHLLAFHHAVGHGMDHFADAEAQLRADGHDELADALRDDVLPSGVVGDDWSYGVVEAFETTMLATVEDYERTLRHRLADGERHLAERRQRERWRRRAEE